MTQRASIFGDDASADDLSDLMVPVKRDKPDADALRKLAEASGFPSRENGRGEGGGVTSAAPKQSTATKGARRRVVKPERPVQLNVRITADHQARFFACLDRLGPAVSQPDGIELAIEKLEAFLDGQS